MLALYAGAAVTSALRLDAPHAIEGGVTCLAVGAAFVTSLLSNPWEEVGWRGFALPRLQASHGAAIATLVVGAMWGLWHAPLFFWVGNPMSEQPFLPWFIGTLAVSFLYTWLYNGTRGSLFAVTLYHVLGNTVGVALPAVSAWALAGVHVATAGVLLACCLGTRFRASGGSVGG